uniref:Uncharacterized protein n=1 Tax=Arundo donax TaxID=35708 RepID=A0A0A9HIJ6_ARUDO
MPVGISSRFHLPRISLRTSPQCSCTPGRWAGRGRRGCRQRRRGGRGA